MDHYFYRNDIAEGHRVCQKEVGWASQKSLDQFEDSVMFKKLLHDGQRWNKKKLKEKYLPITYRDHLMDELIILRQK